MLLACVDLDISLTILRLLRSWHIQTDGVAQQIVFSRVVDLQNFVNLVLEHQLEVVDDLNEVLDKHF
jgi:hypothetical protein